MLETIGRSLATARVYGLLGCWALLGLPLAGISQAYVGASRLKVFGQMKIREKPYIPEQDQDELYIHDTWYPGHLISRSGDILRHYSLRYSVLNEWLEIRVGDQIKVLPDHEIAAFSWLVDRRYLEQYVSGKGLVLEGMPAGGIFEVVFEGEVRLLGRHEKRVVRAHYIPQLDAGKREDEFVKEYIYYITRGKRLYRLPRKARKCYPLFGPHAAKVRRFVKQEYLTFHRKEDLIRIFTFYSELLDAS